MTNHEYMHEKLQDFLKTLHTAIAKESDFVCNDKLLTAEDRLKYLYSVRIYLLTAAAAFCCSDETHPWVTEFEALFNECVAKHQTTTLMARLGNV